jgi:sugar phosphate permease
MLTLIIWGSMVDRIGERLVLVGCAIAAGLFCLVATATSSFTIFVIALGLAGAAAASSNAASGRVVVGWFPPRRRGLAMGIRQMAQPIGVGVAAISVAVVAEHHGPRLAMLGPAVAILLGAAIVAAVVVDPPRPERSTATSANPYRGNRYLARIHTVAVLLVVPQFVVWTFALVWLVDGLGWSAAAAGGLVAVSQLLAAGGRIASGQLSDVVGSRMRPMQWVAAAAAATMAALGWAAGMGWWIAVPLLVVATIVTVADNGLAFTAVAERAGPFWSGRALGLHNTAQYLTSAILPPVFGALITATSYGWAFAAVAVFPLLAVALVPVADERELV